MAETSMRRFIVFKRHEKEDGESWSLDMHDRETLLGLFDELGILYNPPDSWDNDNGVSTEQAAIEDVIENNGDGDDTYMISEIVGDQMKARVM
jgi:hypothetical protein